MGLDANDRICAEDDLDHDYLAYTSNEKFNEDYLTRILNILKSKLFSFEIKIKKYAK